MHSVFFFFFSSVHVLTFFFYSLSSQSTVLHTIFYISHCQESELNRMRSDFEKSQEVATALRKEVEVLKSALDNVVKVFTVQDDSQSSELEVGDYATEYQ